MIYNAKNTAGLGRKCRVYAYAGLEIKGVTKYNTRTREVEFLLFGYTSGGERRVLTTPVTKQLFPRKVVKMKVKIPGSFIMINGKRY